MWQPYKSQRTLQKRVRATTTSTIGGAIETLLNKVPGIIVGRDELDKLDGYEHCRQFESCSQRAKCGSKHC